MVEGSDERDGQIDLSPDHEIEMLPKGVDTTPIDLAHKQYRYSVLKESFALCMGLSVVIFFSFLLYNYLNALLCFIGGVLISYNENFVLPAAALWSLTALAGVFVVTIAAVTGAMMRHSFTPKQSASAYAEERGIGAAFEKIFESVMSRLGK
jgi:hypothetical protein